jgi:hypothetical protein
LKKIFERFSNPQRREHDAHRRSHDKHSGDSNDAPRKRGNSLLGK